ncbi:MAG: LPS assembly protein LptD [Chromatiales bacterium]|nr:LPS assembly protein LptD [Chromatiales bacterium]
MYRLLIPLLAMSAAAAQTVPPVLQPVAPRPVGCGLAPPPLPDALAEFSDEGPPGVQVLSGNVSLRFGGIADLSDGVALRDRDRLLRADGARYDAETGRFTVTGDVEFRDPDTRIAGSAADYDTATGTLRFSEARFSLFRLPARGSAGELLIEQAGRVQLTDVSYTTCPEEREDWVIRASSIAVNRASGMATARNARLEFLGVPILFTPYLTYPVSNQRKSGLLLPEIGTSGKRGFDLEVPWYWNIAPNQDATFTPRYMSRRGVQGQVEYRYLTRGRLPSRGELRGELLPSDKVRGNDRSLVSWFNQTLLGGGWRSTIDAANVSDSGYFEDLQSGVGASSQTHLRRRVDFELFNPAWTVLLRLEDHQTLDDAIVSEDKPYQRLPQLNVRASWPGQPLGLNLGFNSELVYFDRNTGVTGLRSRAMPEVSLPLNWRGLELEPAVALDYVNYALSNTEPGEARSPDRLLPIYSVNLRTVLERASGRGDRFLQTLEPRLQFLHVPFRDQEDLPVFDTIEPDFNLVQLFRRNRFAGHDRYGDTTQLSMGLTTRLLNASDGSQFLAATFGQTRYFRDRQVTLPGDQPSDRSSSDYIGELGLNLRDTWRLSVGYQWDSGEGETSLAEARVLYNPDRQRAVSVAYRFRRDTLEKIDVGLAWPLSSSWSVVGGYDYSLLDSEPIERFIGFDYSTCCWGLRLLLRRNLVGRDGEFDTTVTLQLQLKGLSSSASPAERLLDRGMLRFDRY